MSPPSSVPASSHGSRELGTCCGSDRPTTVTDTAGTTACATELVGSDSLVALWPTPLWPTVPWPTAPWLSSWRTESANWRPIASAIVTAWLAFWSVTVMSTSRLPDGLIAVTRVASRSTVVDSPSRVITGSSTRWLRTMPVKERTFC